MTWLIACEYSGRVRDAFLARGIDAVSCDLLASRRKGPHIRGDVRPLLRQRWDGVIAFPPCTRLANCGVRWLHERNLWDEMQAGAEFFLECLNANAPYVVVENPVMNPYGLALVGPISFSVQPWQFGDRVKKRTCFWTKTLPPLTPTKIVSFATARAEYQSAKHGPDRGLVRARTTPGIAAALADQYGVRFSQTSPAAQS